MAKFDVYNTTISNIIGWIKSDEVAIPEIQRPYVWESSKVRDLLDSLYKGYPVGYIIIWKNPDVRLKDGTMSTGKKILIDGQQRVAALQTSLAGMKVTDANFGKKVIQIAFNFETETFEVRNSAIEKDSKWIPDISKVFESSFEDYSFITQYCQENDLVGQENSLSKIIGKLKSMMDINIGVIDLNQTLSIDEVTDIFIRINSQGTVLSQADFAMSKISADDRYGGSEIRKMIDYFCHFMRRPADYETIVHNDTGFAQSDAFQKIKWAVNELEDIYVPSYTDILRVSFTHKFHRGKIADLVSLLSGRDFESRENYEYIVADSFKLLREGVESFVNQTNFERYVLILRSAGIVSSSLVRSQNVLNFGYILYLTLRDSCMNQSLIETLVRKWIVLSMLTGRYSGSADSSFDYDIKRISETDSVVFIRNMEASELSDDFWDKTLITRLDTSVSNSPYYLVYLMAQAKNNARGFLSKNIDVKSLIEQTGDVHHIFPKKYLQKNGITIRGKYNQVANYAYTQSEINIKISDKAPNEYMQTVIEQVSGGPLVYGGITAKEDLNQNMEENCIPNGLSTMDFNDYDSFLEQRRILMAQYIHDYYRQLG